MFLTAMCAVIGMSRSLEGQEIEGLKSRPKRYNVSICSIFKNEAKYLKEWIEYHRLIGIDHFYLYNNESTDRFMEVLTPYVKKGIVTLIHWPDRFPKKDADKSFMWSLATQVTAYENLIRLRAARETKWLVIVNVDEYLVPPNESTLIEVLNKYDEFPGVTLASDFFDASKMDELPKKRLLIETVELTCRPEQNMLRGVTKTIFKPDQADGFTWPPYQCMFKNEQPGITIRKRELRINHYVNRNMGYLQFGKAKQPLQVDSRMLSEDETVELLEDGYQVIDHDRAIFRFVPQLLDRLGFEPTRNW
jgi:hypothetical protein